MEEHVDPWVGKAKKIDALLIDLQNEIDAARNPNRVALKSLQVTSLGWTPLIYSNEAFDTWSKLHKQDPGDLELLHHLAIMYHARAIHLEQTDDPSSADDDWAKSMECWHTLWQSDAFWDSLAGSVCRDGKRTPVDELRQDLPILFLKIHFDIAIDKETSRSRINYHIRKVMESPFPEEAKERVRNDAYERFSRQIPDAIWETQSPDPEEALKALEVIRNFLERDPGCITALSDALSIFIRLLRSRMTDLQAMDSDNTSARQTILQELRKLGQEWGPYFEIIHEESHKVEDTVKGNLSLWCRVMGDVACGLEERNEGINYFREGTRSDLEDDTEAALCARKIGQTEALQARSMARNRESGAKDLCDRLRPREDLTIAAHIYLAHAYKFLDEFDLAEAVCTAGIALEPEYVSFEIMDEDEKDREILKGFLDDVLGEKEFTRAREFVDTQDFEKAIPLLDKAIEFKNTNAVYYLFRAHCLIEIAEAEKALKDMESCRTYGGEDIVGSQTIQDKEKQIHEQLDDQKRLGKATVVVGKKVQRHLNRNEYAQAAFALLGVMDQSSSPGNLFIKARLSNVLANWAITRVNEAQADSTLTPENLGEIQTENLEMMREACALDPGNDHVKQNMRVIEDNVVFGLRGMGIKAYNENNLDKAISCHRKVINLCKPDMQKECRKELAIFIHAKAVKIANKAIEERNKIFSQWRP